MVCPPKLDHPLEDGFPLKFAHSDKFALPTTTRPAFFNLDTICESFLGILFSKARDPAVFGRPTESILSLINIGTPFNPS